MNKKKIAGLLVFTFILSFYLTYPKIKDMALDYRVSFMLENEQYQRVYDLLSKRKLDPDSNHFLNLLRANIVLDNDDARLMINTLIANDHLESIQHIVDEFGISLGYNLAAIDYMGGIAYNDEVSEYLVSYHLLRRNIARAMELRGDSDAIDLVYLTYLASSGDISKYLEIYEEVPEDLKEDYYMLLNWEIICLGLNERYSGYPESEATFLSELQKYYYPEEVLLRIARFFVDNSNLGVGGSLNHPFFTENIYFQFFKAHSELNDPVKREDSLLVLKSAQFKNIPGRDRLIELAESATDVHHMIEVSQGRIFHYTYRSGMSLTPQNHIFNLNTNTEQRVNFEQYSNYSVSPNREYMIERRTWGFGVRYIIIDEHFTIKHTIDELNISTMFVEYWINDWEVVLVDTKTLERQVLNAFTGQIRDYAGEKAYTHGFEPAVKGTKIWSINEERYIGLEPRSNVFHYVIRDRETHHEIERIPLEYDFLGSCDAYIYGIKTEEDFIKVLVKQSIKTGEVYELPFYSIMPNTGTPRFVNH